MAYNTINEIFYQAGELYGSKNLFYGKNEKKDFVGTTYGTVLKNAENLGLAIGMEVHAFVKAPSVIIITDPQARTTARNHLWGEVTRIHEGPVSSEVTITLPGGRNMTSVVTHDSIENLELAIGLPACAVFQASSVILAVFD